MTRLLVALGLLATANVAHARSLEGEGTVSLLPSVYLPAVPHDLKVGGTSLGATAAFGYKPESSLRIGIDIGASVATGALSGRSYQLLAVPLMIAGDLILIPESDIRPFLQAAAGKEFLAVSSGSYYKEHTPALLQLAAGVEADISEGMGLMFDAGYLWARTPDGLLGNLDGGGPFVRMGITFRFEPKKKW